MNTPVLTGQYLQVREPERPATEERAVLEKEEGKDAITEEIDEETGRPKETWVRWHEVPDFFGSGPRDRHYVVNHITGEIGFGDGLRGLVPPAGVGNIRLARYRTGGGEAGNRPENTITQLKTTIPHIDTVTNAEPASGGADAEPLESLVRRAPRTLRHRGRAVTVEDYQDLAMLASPRVARAKCVPLRDLAIDPDAAVNAPGKISLIVVPRSQDAKPVPTIELIGRVQTYVDERRVATADLVIVGPEYIRVAIEAEIAVETLEGASDVRHQVMATLSRFLHPLTGGLSGEGWDFGRKPYKSDLFALIEAIPGVDHVRTLDVNETEDRAGSGATGLALVYSGAHTIRMTYVET
jgi:predicted phage baseplate assembly protein